MKKVFLFVFVMLAISFAAIESYAQILQESSLPLSLTDFGTYHSYLRSEMNKDLFSSPSFSYIKSDKHENSFVDKMGAGAINTTTCWTDIPKEITGESARYNLFVGCTIGLGKGLVLSFARGMSGVTDVATFGLLPSDKPLMEPEYKVERPDDGFKIKLLEW